MRYCRLFLVSQGRLDVNPSSLGSQHVFFTEMSKLSISGRLVGVMYDFSVMVFKLFLVAGF